MAQHVRVTINTVHGFAPAASLSEVRFYYIPTFATGPKPESGATDVAPDLSLSWGRDGREADHHDVYLGADASSLSLAGSVGGSSFDTGASDLQLGQTYTWRVNEVNDAMDPSTWEGSEWTFTTADAIVIDDMEGYRDEEFLEIWATWVDGFLDPANGSLVGNGGTGSPETDTVHGGSQSLPLHYDNTAAPSSEAKRTFSPAQDWTRGGVQTLVLHFSGDPANTDGQIYCTLNGMKVLFGGDADALVKPRWTQWNIDLSAVNVDLQAVTSLGLGVEGGGAGVVLVDDILLYGQASSADREEIWIEGEAADTLGERWAVTEDPAASAGKYLGSVDGDGDDNGDPPGADWLATYKFNVTGGTYSLSARIITLPGNSFWFRIAGATSPQITRPDGWINTNPMDNGDAWHWDEDVVELTLAAGEHTLEIAKREDGTLLDAFVISEIIE